MNSTTNSSSATKARIVEIDEEKAGQRIDNFLLKSLKGLPKSRVYRIIRKGEVRINGKRVKPERRLAAGDQVRIPPLAHLPERDSAVGHFKDLDGLILHEDKALLVINKPAGMAVHGGSGQSVGVIESLRHALPEGDRLELVHRLDRGTSGCLMVAKKRRYLRLLQEALRHPGTIRKTYLALVHGEWGQPVTIKEPLLTVSRAGLERYTRVDSDGKPAETRFEALAANKTLSLVAASPLTGRTHQIRVHARWNRHPLVGDDRYGDQTMDSDIVRGTGSQAGRTLMLHAWRLQIPLLEDFPAVTVSALPPESMTTCFRNHFSQDLESFLK